MELAVRKLLILIVLVGAVYQGWQHFGKAGSYSGNSDASAAEISALAATVRPEDVVMYSTTECPYCAQAKGWLNQNGFAFTECNMSNESHCENEFKSYGANGTPFLVVRRGDKTHYMKDGFDSDEFIAALRS
ncbi:MAG TPA: glutaredoxin family protein [Rhodocyclaceae bacterium]|nr:glutaredoxin family protein [Rhodocyclaceae bacterium]